MTYKDKYNQWLQSENVDTESKNELLGIKDEKEIEDRFYKDLEFGTGGLRGIIGTGTNRMNVYTVGKATQGFADYLKREGKERISVSIAFDSRNKSKEFAEAAALILCANGIKVNLFEDLRPTPVLSYTVRYLKCDGGIVITASHNPKQYNGYKAYGADGGQLTDKNADEVLSYIEAIDSFSEVKKISREEVLNSGLLNIIGEAVDKTYIERVKGLTIRRELVEKYAGELKLIYTPIHGSGNIPVRRVLTELGYKQIFVPKEQELPDGNFPTAPYPNPEDPKVFKIALNMASEINPDIIFGTDPDSDRIGLMVKDNEGKYKVLSGNQTGILLTNYIISSLKELNKLPANGIIVKTIVTTEMVRVIAEDYKVDITDVLTGFKYIGEKIKEYEENGEKTYLFGFEESFGYLAGDFVRDKDAVIAAEIVCEMCLYYKKRGKTLYNALMELYEKYGFYDEKLISVELKGKEGQEKIQKAIDYLRNNINEEVKGTKIVKKFDYREQVEKDIVNSTITPIDLPVSNVLKFILEDNSWFVVRPSGTEPKMKIYLSVTGISIEDSEEKMVNFEKTVMSIIDEGCNC